MKEQIMSDKKKALLNGPVGFDEANYYLDKTSDLGFKSNDEDLKILIEESIAKHRVLSLSQMTVTVSAGIATLKGLVQGPSEKKEASFIAQQIEGIKAVINHLQF